MLFRIFFTAVLVFSFFLSSAQSLSEINQKIYDKTLIKWDLEQQLNDNNAELEQLKLLKIDRELSQIGPVAMEEGEEIVKHRAFQLVYSEKYELPKWVAHIIIPDIMEGKATRTNAFLIDSAVKSGTAEEKDYFLKYLQEDSSYIYDGYGYDRGHMAPSADFRWSPIALAESYFYSNMSPQVPELNQGAWAELESYLRGYIYKNPKSSLFVVTGPIFDADMEKMERSEKNLYIPKRFFKVAIDITNEKGIAFIMPNKKCNYPVEHYALSIDSVETITGLDFFNLLKDDLESKLESQKDYKPWLPDSQTEDAVPINVHQLPRGHFNTVQAKIYVNSGQKIKVCGTVVSVFESKNGHVFINLDKKFPEQIFTVSIFKDDLVNFGINPKIEWLEKKMCFKGKVASFNGTPGLNIDKENDASEFEPISK